METITKSNIIDKMNYYQDCAMERLSSWLGDSLPRIYGVNWKAYLVKSTHNKGKLNDVEELENLDLLLLLKTALSESNFESLCKELDNPSFDNDEIKYILEGMHRLRNHYSHRDIKLPDNALILAQLTRVESFFTLFSEPDILADVDEFRSKIKNCRIIDNVKKTNGNVTDFYNYVLNQSNESKGLSIAKENGRFVVKGIGDCKDSTIIIPRTKKVGDNFYSVQGIAYKAFYGCTEIERIIIPEGVIFIESEAFSKCTRLKDINIPHSLMSIGRNAFEDCVALDGIYIDDIASWCAVEFENTLSNPLHLARKMYLKGEEKNNIEIPEGVESISDFAFYDCSFLEDVSFPDSVYSIGALAFCNCISLKNIVLPNYITSIGASAFKNCKSFDEIKIPQNISRVDDGVFYGCTGVERIYFCAELLNDNCDSKNETIFAMVGGQKECLNITIGSNVKEVPMKLFKSLYGNSSYNDFVKGINVLFEDGSTCRRIGDEAFNGCKNLMSINFPNSLTSIGKFAFNECSSLTEITIPLGVKDIDERAFSYTGIIKANISDGVTSIGNGAFKECVALKKISIPQTVINLGEEAFMNALALEKIDFLAQITKIYPRTFYGCSAISKLVIPNTVEEIDDFAFFNCKAVSSFVLSDNLKIIHSNAFADCRTLSTITIPRNVVSIDDNAFYGCSSVERIEFNPDEIQSVSGDAFNGVGSEEKGVKLFIGKNVIRIPDILFDVYSSDCLVTDVIFEKGSRCKYIGYFSFGECHNLKKINIPQSVTHMGKEAFYNTAITYVCIPKGVTELQEDVFGRCYLLEKINIPDSVKYISNGAFCGCTSLTDLTISEGVEYIGDNAFNGCESIKYLRIPSSIKHIETGAFCGCTSLTELTISEGVEYIGDSAFSGCESIKYLRIPSSIKHIGTMAFSGCVQLENIYFNAVNMEDLSSGDVFFDAGRDSENLTVTVGANVSQIPARLFCTCPTFVDVDIVPGCYIRSVIFEKESKCKKIGDAAFEDCLCLTDFFIPQSLKDMGENVFSECESLTDFYFIGDYEDFVKYCHNSSFRFEGNVKIYLYSECEPTEQGDGLYWYYDETGKPVHW